MLTWPALVRAKGPGARARHGAGGACAADQRARRAAQPTQPELAAADGLLASVAAGATGADGC